MATEKDKFENALADEGEGQLTVDVYQTPTEIVVQAPIAGIHKDEINVEATSESVTIRGERKRGEKSRKAITYIRNVSGAGSPGLLFCRRRWTPTVPKCISARTVS